MCTYLATIPDLYLQILNDEIIDVEKRIKVLSSQKNVLFRFMKRLEFLQKKSETLKDFISKDRSNIDKVNQTIIKYLSLFIGQSITVDTFIQFNKTDPYYAVGNQEKFKDVKFEDFIDFVFSLN